jgi:hypothetical protein
MLSLSGLGAVLAPPVGRRLRCWRAPADDRVLEHMAEIEQLMMEGMLTVLPGMNVRVETVVSQSLNKAEVDPRYCEQR